MRAPRHVITALALLVTGTVAGVAVQQSVSADVSSGDRPVLIQISPCRLADTRPAPNNVGPRLGTFNPAETITFDVQNSSTDCAGSIPTDAVGLSMNVTALGATVQSFYTIWPSGPRPTASSLNPAPGEPATPNAVATPIDAGTFNVFNNRGSNHIIIDINGYYVNHNHDDLYSAGPDPTVTSVGLAAFDAWENQFGWQRGHDVGAASGGAWITGNPHGGFVPALVAPVQLPHGSDVTAVTAAFSDTSATASLAFQLRCEEFDGTVKIVASGSTTGLSGTDTTPLSITTSNATIDNTTCSYFVVAESGSWGSEGAALKIRGFSITTS